MGKHLNQLRKLNKRQIGLTSDNITTEEVSLTKRRKELGSEVYIAGERVIAATILNNVVTKYHLVSDSATLPKGVTDPIFSELSEKIEDDKTITTHRGLVTTFLNKNGTNHTKIFEFSEEYSLSKLKLHLFNLINSGKLTIVVSKESPGLSEESTIMLNKVVGEYYPTYKKDYTSHLPVNIGIQRVDKPKFGPIETISNKISKDMIEYNQSTKSIRMTSISGVKIIESNSLSNLKKEVILSETNRLTYGVDLLKKSKESLETLNLEYGTINSKLISLSSEKTTITSIETTNTETKSNLEKLVDTIDNAHIKKLGIINIITAKSAHTDTLKIYTGVRLNALIKVEIAKGNFEVEVDELTDMEAKILLDNGYEVIESDAPILIGKTVSTRLTWTIRWENSASTSS